MGMIRQVMGAARNLKENSARILADREGVWITPNK